MLAGLSLLSLRWALKENAERKTGPMLVASARAMAMEVGGAAVVAPRDGAVGEDGWTGQDQGSHDDASTKLG